jgi:hypothetical protein
MAQNRRLVFFMAIILFGWVLNGLCSKAHRPEVHEGVHEPGGGVGAELPGEVPWVPDRPGRCEKAQGTPKGCHVSWVRIWAKNHLGLVQCRVET